MIPDYKTLYENVLKANTELLVEIDRLKLKLEAAAKVIDVHQNKCFPFQCEELEAYRKAVEK